MVERFHRQLKVALKNPTSWMDALPLALLGMQTALKEDISSTTADMLYGASPANSTHVFIRRGAVRKPLQPPYDGPYSVLERTDKHFTVDINSRKETALIDRLKPAHLDSDTPNPAQTIEWTDIAQYVTTRSGRVHFPKYFTSYTS